MYAHIYKCEFYVRTGYFVRIVPYSSCQDIK